jgi:hypothetical protein
LFFLVFNTQRLALGFSVQPWRMPTSEAEAQLNGLTLPPHEAVSKRFWAYGLPRVA